MNDQVAAEASAADTSTSELGSNNQFLTFGLSGETYAINILNIREITKYGMLTPVPMMPDAIAGVINLRGSVVPVINLAERFGKNSAAETKRTSIVIVEIDRDDARAEIGIIVDMVNEVLDINSNDIEPAPGFGSNIRTDFIAGMGKVDDGFLVLIDVNHVLSVDELSVVNEVKNPTQH